MPEDVIQENNEWLTELAAPEGLPAILLPDLLQSANNAGVLVAYRTACQICGEQPESSRTIGIVNAKDVLPTASQRWHWNRDLGLPPRLGTQVRPDSKLVTSGHECMLRAAICHFGETNGGGHCIHYTIRADRQPPHVVGYDDDAVTLSKLIRNMC